MVYTLFLPNMQVDDSKFWPVIPIKQKSPDLFIFDWFLLKLGIEVVSYQVVSWQNEKDTRVSSIEILRIA